MILVHRHTFPVRDVIEMLLDASPEADRWQMRVEGDELVIDIVGPVSAKAATNIQDQFRSPQSASDEGAKINTPPQSATEAPGRAIASDRPTTPENEERAPAATEPGKDEPELKGGRLARDASMLCQDKTFRLWIDADDADQAREIVLRHCGVESRRLLDHDEAAAGKWREIDRLYAAWMNGDDEAVMPENEEMVL